MRGPDPLMGRKLRLLAVGLCCVALAVGAAGRSHAEDASKPASPSFAYVTVSGAPGDGESALAGALYNELASAGIKEAPPESTAVYEIEGTVKLSLAKRGRQNIEINWMVFDPDGNTLGHVAQRKVIRKGSLDRAWGSAAVGAASAAADGILKLMPH